MLQLLLVFVCFFFPLALLPTVVFRNNFTESSVKSVLCLTCDYGVCQAALLTWCSVHGQVSEVAALDELHRHASRGSVVGEAHQQLRDTAVGQRLSG